MTIRPGTTRSESNTAVAIRTARPDDADAVRAVLEASYPALMAGAYPPAVLAALLPRMVDANPRLLGSGRYYLAEVAGAVAGCGGWSRERPGGGAAEPGLGHIRHFAVRADRAGRGIGRALMQRCLAEARADGVVLLECYASLNAEGFYRAMGFRTVGPLDVRMGPGPALPSMLMRRPVGA
ncbi:MAG: GNAT family N-acetyltransferase [Alphaproteobacteria bacterium]